MRTLVLFAILAAALADQLVLVQMLHRHGDRTPVMIPPSVLAAGGYAGMLPGQLTDLGAQMLKAAGRTFRSMYMDTGYLPPHYTPGTMYVRSTDVDRCLMSAQAFYSTAYPGDQLPIHTVPVEWEELLQMEEHCPSWSINIDLVDTQYASWLTTNHADLINRMYQWTGWTPAQIDATDLLFTVADNIVCGLAHNITIDPVLLQNFTAIRDLVMQISWAGLELPANDPRGSVGEELGFDMLKNFDAVVSTFNGSQGTYTGPFFHHYSAHDSTITALSFGFGLATATSDLYLIPPYAMSMLLELWWVSATNKFEVKFRQGFPTRVSPDSDLYTYNFTNAYLNCPTPSMNCEYTAWKAFVNTQIKEDGCCVVADGFHQLGCDQYDESAANIPEPCLLFRLECPQTACGADRVVNTVDYSCAAIASPSPTLGAPQLVAIGAGSMAAIVILFFFIYRQCNKKVVDPQYNPITPQ